MFVTGLNLRRLVLLAAFGLYTSSCSAPSSSESSSAEPAIKPSMDVLSALRQSIPTNQPFRRQSKNSLLIRNGTRSISMSMREIVETDGLEKATFTQEYIGSFLGQTNQGLVCSLTGFYSASDQKAFWKNGNEFSANVTLSLALQDGALLRTLSAFSDQAEIQTSDYWAVVGLDGSGAAKLAFEKTFETGSLSKKEAVYSFERTGALYRLSSSLYRYQYRYEQAEVTYSVENTYFYEQIDIPDWEFSKTGAIGPYSYSSERFGFSPLIDVSSSFQYAFPNVSKSPWWLVCPFQEDRLVDPEGEIVIQDDLLLSGSGFYRGKGRFGSAPTALTYSDLARIIGR